MPFCPNCRYEYLPEISVCPDCEAELVAELPDLQEWIEKVEWRALKPLPGVIYAKMVAEVLDQREIPNYIQSLFGSGGIGIVSGGDFAGASARIWVPEDRKNEAEEIQEEIFPDT